MILRPQPRKEVHEEKIQDDFGWKADTMETETKAPVLPNIPSKLDFKGMGVPKFYFHIGTVDAFERKLEEAQRDVGIHPRDFIPVVYNSDSGIAKAILE